MLEIGLVGSYPSCSKVGISVARNEASVVVIHLVIVPDIDPGRASMRELQVQVAFV